ncbi:MAG: NAD(+) synthase [Bacillota bacterium]
MGEGDFMDAEQVASAIVKWMQKQLSVAGAQGFVVGVSGGVDSAVVLGLSARAAPGRVLALVMPCESQAQDLEDAERVIQHFGVEKARVDLTPVYHQLLAQFTCGDCAPPLAKANLKPRLRMISLYFYANTLNYLVAGTGNRSEAVMGYFTKYGDGGVDILPIGCLLKREVREIARYLGVPGGVITKPPTAGLWAGQTDEGEMGVTYAELDELLYAGVGSPALAQLVHQRFVGSHHKRVVAPVPERFQIGLS